MDDTMISCRYCGHTFPVAKGPGGGRVVCPLCEREQTVPAPPPKVRVLKNHVGVTPMKNCPKCGTESHASAVICTQCGYHWHTGKTIRLDAHTSILDILNKVALILIAAVVVGLAVKALWSIRFPAEGPGYFAPAPDRRFAEERVEPAVPVAEPTTDLPHPDGVSPREPRSREDAAEEQVRNMEARRQELAADLDRQHPMVQRGERVMLEQQGGLIHRGEFVSVRDGRVLLVDGEYRVRVSLEDLTMRSRLRCDEAYREQVIEERLRREFPDVNP